MALELDAVSQTLAIRKGGFSMPDSIFAEFDGNVIIPEQPLDYPAGQRLRITVEVAGAPVWPELAKILPSELEQREDEAIVVRGQRLALHLIVDAMNRGANLEEIHERFPQVEEDRLRRIIDFCRDHAEPVRRYCDQQQAITRQFCDVAHQGPTRDELLARRSGTSHG